MTPRTETPPPDPYRWVILGVLWVTFIVVFLSRLSVGPLGPFFKDALHISSAQVGFVLSAAAFGYAASQLPIGVIVDRVGARWPIAIGEFVAGASMLGIFFAPSYRSLLVLMFLAGCGCGLLAPSTTQGVVAWFPQRERATVMGLKQTAVNLGGMLGAVTLPWIALRYGWRAGFLCLGFVAIAVGIVSAALYREPGRPQAADGRASPERVTLGEILHNRNIWFVGLTGLCLNWIELSVIGHFVLYLRGLGFPVVAAGGLLALVEGAGAIARPVSGVVSDRLFAGRRNPVFKVFSGVTAVACLVLGIAGPRLGWLMYPVLFALGVGGIGWGGVFLTLLSEFGGARGAGKAAALGSMVSVVGSILGPPVFGHVVDVTGSYQVAWLSLAAIGSLCLILLAFVDESERLA